MNSDTAEHEPPEGQSPGRARKIQTISVWAGFLLVIAAILSVPLMPWIMGIVGSTPQGYLEALPLENRGAYLLTTRGFVELFEWHILFTELPEETPVFNSSDLQYVAVVQKQFSLPDAYQLINLENGAYISWQSSQEKDRQLILDPGPLPPGEYLFIRDTDDMFGGVTYHYFRVQ